MIPHTQAFTRSTISYQIVDDVGVVVDCLVHHQAQDAHLRRAAVVELDRLRVQRYKNRSKIG